MPGKGITNAKRNRAGALGQSSRFFNIYGKQVSSSAHGAFKGGEGWGTHNPSIGSFYLWEYLSKIKRQVVIMFVTQDQDQQMFNLMLLIVIVGDHWPNVHVDLK